MPRDGKYFAYMFPISIVGIAGKRMVKPSRECKFCAQIISSFGNCSEKCPSNDEKPLKKQEAFSLLLVVLALSLCININLEPHLNLFQLKKSLAERLSTLIYILMNRFVERACHSQNSEKQFEVWIKPFHVQSVYTGFGAEKF